MREARRVDQLERMAQLLNMSHGARVGVRVHSAKGSLNGMHTIDATLRFFASSSIPALQTGADGEEHLQSAEGSDGVRAWAGPWFRQ